MKKNSKQILCIIISVVMLTFCLPMPQVKAANNTVELSVDYLNRERCWMEAANFLHLGYSQADIAVEIYAHALADNVSYRYLKNSLVKNGFNQVYLLSRLVNDHSHVVNIGGDNGSPDRFLKLYYALWNSVYLPNNNTYYSIHSDLNQNKVIDVSNNSNKNGTKIQLYSKNGTSAQEFEFFYAGDMDGISWYYILKKGQFKCLDVTGGNAKSGVNVQLYEYNGTPAQQWCLVSTGEGFYYLRNRLGFYMDACGGNSKNGTQIWVYEGNGTSAQRWWIKSK